MYIKVKRIHEYKRQLLNILGIVYRYKQMKEMTLEEREAKFVPRVCIFGGKAFATYVQAKRIVKFIADVGATVNNDPDIGDLLKVPVQTNMIKCCSLASELLAPRETNVSFALRAFKTSFFYR